MTLWLALSAFGAEPGILFENARLVDADGIRTVDALVVRGDRIVSAGPVPDDVEGLEVVDLAGASVVPGLIDAHVHLSLTPSGAFMELTRDEELDLWRHHLAAYVACGVTTVLDTGILPEDAAVMRVLAEEGPAPDIQLLGPLLSPEGGYVSVVLPAFPPATNARDVADQMDAFTPLAPVGVKITLEQGMVFKTWPLYSDEVSDAIQREAKGRDLPLFAHAMSNKEFDLGLQMGVAGFVHPPEKPSRALISELAGRQLPVVTTVSAFESLKMVPNPDRLTDHPIPLVVPGIELDHANDPVVHEAFAHTVADHIIPKMPGFVRNQAARMFRKDGLIDSRTKKMQKALLKLHEAGVPLVVGSDSGNWPVFPFEFHGPTTLRELELVHEAGIPAMAALEAATAAPAKMIGMEDEIGRLKPGMRADLIIVEADPTADLSALRRPTWVVRGGVMNTPEGWMAALPDATDGD